MPRGARFWLNHCAVAALLVSNISAAPMVFASSVPDSLQACTREGDADRRLACYDREMVQMGAAPVAPAVAPASAPVADRTFGLSPEQLRKLQPRESADKPKPQILSSMLASVSTRADGRMVFTLSNGQTWLQGEAYETFHVNVGDPISIRPGALGSFHLYAPGGYATRVTRAR
jgi:hypothetical protein